MIHEIVKDQIKPMWNIITLTGVSGGVYWMGNIKGASERPYNLIFMRKDEGMFSSLKEVSEYLTALN